MIMESFSDSEQDDVKKDLVLRAVNGNKTSETNGRTKKKMKQEERHVDSDDDEDDEENDFKEEVTDDESLKKCLLSATYISRSNGIKRSPEKKRLKQEDISGDEDDDVYRMRNGNGRPKKKGLKQEEIRVGSDDTDDDDDDMTIILLRRRKNQIQTMSLPRKI